MKIEALKYDQINKNSLPQKPFNKTNKAKQDISFKSLANYSLMSYMADIKQDNSFGFDIKNPDSYVLKNNLQVDTESSQFNKKANALLVLSFDADTQKKGGSLEILTKMINTQNGKNANDVSIVTDNSQLMFRAETDSNKINGQLQEMVNLITAPNLTQENLNSAKQSVKNELSKSSALDTLNNMIYFKNKKLTDKDIDAISLEDINELYLNILANSQAKITITLPLKSQSQDKMQLVNTLSELPTFKEKSAGISYSALRPISKTQTHKCKTNNPDKSHLRYYYIGQNDSVAKTAAEEVMGILFNKVLTANFPDANNYETSSDYITGGNASSIIIGLNSKNSDYKQNSKLLDDVIKQLSEGKIDPKMLKDAKSVVRYQKIKIYKDQCEKTEIMQNQYAQGDNSLKCFLDALDKVTAQNISEAAQKIFSQPYLEAVEE